MWRHASNNSSIKHEGNYNSNDLSNYNEGSNNYDDKHNKQLDGGNEFGDRNRSRSLRSMRWDWLDRRDYLCKWNLQGK